MTWKLVLRRQCQCFWLFRTSIWTFWMSQIPSKFHQNSIRSSRNRHEQSMFNRCLHLRTWSKMQNVYNFRIVSPAMLARELNVLPEPSGLEGHVGCRWLIEEGWSWPGRGCYLMATSARQIGDTISFLQRPHSNLTKNHVEKAELSLQNQSLHSMSSCWNNIELVPACLWGVERPQD